VSRKRPDRPARTERRVAARAARDLVRDRERLAALEPGGAADHPIAVPSAAVIELRAGRVPCPQCAGSYDIKDHASAGGGLRRVDVRCRTCGVPRALWFRIVEALPS
jgi:predicted Zn finger-like uncharacterized protein